MREPVPSSLLILASTSLFRKALLTAAAIPFRAVASGVDERAPRGVHPKELARILSLKKAQAVSARYPEALVVGSDQTAELDGRLLRKPGSRSAARAQLRAMSGKTHWLHTGVALARGSPRVRRVALASVKLTLRDLSAEEIDAYLDTGEWEGCAGSYRIEAQGIKLMEGIKGEHSAIVGLPMVKLIKMLAAEEFPLFQ